jgi:hypothetical protein
MAFIGLAGLVHFGLEGGDHLLVDPLVLGGEMAEHQPMVPALRVVFSCAFSHFTQALTGFGDLDRIDGIHVAPGRLAVAGRCHLAGVHIQRQRDIAQAGEFGGHRLDLIV